MNARAWIERRWWWLPLLALVVLNLLALTWYALVYSGAARSVDQQLEQRARELSAVQAAVAIQEETLERLELNRARLEEFYSTRIAPPSQRLTGIIREVRTLARTAGMQPTSLDYPRDELSDYGLVKRRFSFSVEGSYAQLRRFVNLLELTDSFLTLEEVSLTGRGEDSQLRISLRLSTLFVMDDVPATDEAAADEAAADEAAPDGSPAPEDPASRSAENASP